MDDTKNMATKAKKTPALKALLDCRNEATIFGRHHLAIRELSLSILWTSVDIIPLSF
jgi:hypothetical protein